jgi:hypothetical protein
MRKIVITAVAALAVAPAAVGAPPPNAADRANAVRDCRALRDSMGLATFRTTYGTAQANRRNAFGRCLSQWAREEQENRLNAAQECGEERGTTDASRAAFNEKYGKNGNARNAFGRCVSAKARAEAREDREETLNAAQQCKEERGTTEQSRAAFGATYGANENDRNAFGKCVSTLAREQDED